MLPPMAIPPTIPKKTGANGGIHIGGFTATPPPVEGPGGWRLKPASGRVAGTIVLGFMALFWNGVTWTALITTWRAEHGLAAGGITIFLSIFALIGLFLAGAFVMMLLKALFTPQLALTLSKPRLTLGSATDLAWNITKGRQRLVNLKISLLLREECQYRRGTDTLTDRHAAHELTVYEHAEPDADGRCALLIPATLPPSFTTTANQLVWSIKLSGTVPGLPDVDDEYAVAVDPPQSIAASLAPAPLPTGTVLPEDSPPLVLTNGGIGTLPGVPVAGVVHAPGKPVTLRLRWAINGKGDVQGATVATTMLAADAAGFILVLPSLPPLWQGTVLSLTWHLEAEVDGALFAALAFAPALTTA